MEELILAALLVAVLVVVVLWPSDWGYKTNAQGRRSGWWYSAIYQYHYGPGYERVQFPGLRRLQFWLLFVLTTVISRLQPELISWITEALRHALGL